MLFVHRSSRNRRAFTLIELLTVVVIIGILAGLVTAAALRVRTSVRKARHAIELKELEMALHAYKDRFGEFPPDSAGDAVQRHLRKAFPRSTAAAPAGLTPSTALTFWLGGVKDADGNFTGFSANPMNPFEQGGSRIGPFFTNFDYDRLASNGLYYPTIEAKAEGGAERAIHYYRAQNGVYSGTYAFKDSRTANGWINPRSFQILSPGLQGGVLGAGNAAFPDGLSEAHLEMMSNFTGGTMEDALK